jgi:hypothetical protein
MGEPKEGPPGLDVLIFIVVAAFFAPIVQWHAEAGTLFWRFRRKLRPRMRLKALAARMHWPSVWKRPTSRVGPTHNSSR